MVTSVARYAYRMQSVAAPAAAVPAAGATGHPPQGMVYVCSHHQQWILSLEHLAPPPPGRAYHVQFRTAGGVVDGGILRVGADARAGMEDVKLPPGTTRLFGHPRARRRAPATPCWCSRASPACRL